MTMKKIFFITGLIILVLVSVYFILDNNTVRKPFATHGVYATYNNLGELENLSDLIIVAVPKNNEHVEGKHYTFTNVEVKKILKKDKERKFKEGDILKVEEPYFISNEPIVPGQTLYTLEGYTEMIKGNQYILYLQYNESLGHYYINSFTFGQYLLDMKFEKEKENHKNSNKLRDSIQEEIKIKHKDLLKNNE